MRACVVDVRVEVEVKGGNLLVPTNSKYHSAQAKPIYSAIGRPSINPELMNADANHRLSDSVGLNIAGLDLGAER